MTLSALRLASLVCLIGGIFAPSSVAARPEVAVRSSSDFCLFLPPRPGLEVAINEDNGIPFCTKKNLVPHAKEFPRGFIKGHHFNATREYVQVTGYFDRSKYKLSPKDGGGQYDSHAKHKPIGAMCKGYPYFVSLIEPDIQRFCIRCCKRVVSPLWHL